MNENQILRNRLLPIWIIIILYVTLKPGGGNIRFAIPHIDKLLHFTIFFILSINISYKYQNSTKLIGMLFGGILLGLLTEFFQQFIPGRNLDFYDAVADTLGMMAGYVIHSKLKVILNKILLKLGA